MNDSVENKIDILIEEQKIQSLILNRLLLKIDNLENILKIEKEMSSSRYEKIDDSFLTNFPLSNPTMFATVESHIKNDSSFSKKLVGYQTYHNIYYIIYIVFTYFHKFPGIFYKVYRRL